MKKSKETSNGASIIEIIIAIGMFLYLITSTTTLVVGSLRTTIQGEKRLQAQAFVQEAAEALLAIHDEDWSLLTQGEHGLSRESGAWTLSGTQSTSGEFGRRIVITDITANLKSADVIVWWPSLTGAQETFETHMTLSQLSAGDSCENITIDFEEFHEGEKIERVGPIAISVRNDNSNHENRAIAFDSGHPVGDPDLATPGYHPSNTVPLGKLLIIAENVVDRNPQDGYVDVPDDENQGGVIFFRSDHPITVQSIDLIDGEGTGNKIRLYRLNGDNLELSRTIDLSPGGDNSVATIMIGEENVSEMRLRMIHSGAADNLIISPCPNGN